ncbi:MAG: hypothetical protein ABI284_04845 [Nitrosospira sp.]
MNRQDVAAYFLPGPLSPTDRWILAGASQRQSGCEDIFFNTAKNDQFKQAL